MAQDPDETLSLLELFPETPPQKDETSIKIEDDKITDTTDGNVLTKKKKQTIEHKKIKYPTKAKQNTDLKRNNVHNAAEVGDAEQLLKLVKEDPQSLGIQDANGQTPLHLAVIGMHKGCCEILLEESTKEINIKDKKGFTPLLLSIQPGAISFQITNLLLSKSADLSKRNHAKKTALHIATEKGNLDTVKLFLKNDKESVHAIDSEHITPLHIAAKKGLVSICTELLNISDKIDKEAKDNHGYTALHWAAKIGFQKTVAVLLKSGYDINCIDKEGNTPLHLFCLREKDRPHYSERHAECAKFLLESHSNPNARNKEGKTPFHIAQSCSYEVLAMFQDYPVDLTITDNKKKTPLHFAAKRKSSKPVSIILSMKDITNIDKEAFINAKDEDNKTALHMAVETGIMDSCKVLIKNGADVYATCNSNTTVLHLAAEKGFTSMCAFLIAKGMKAVVKNTLLQTPLHLAAKNGHNECCQILLKQGADPSLGDIDGNTALHLAVNGTVDNSQEEYISCCMTIMKFCPSSVRIHNKHNKSVFHIAVENNSLECCKALIKDEINIWSYRKGDVQSPIKLAYDNASYEIFQYLLHRSSTDTPSDSTIDIDFCKLMKDSLENQNLEVVEAIISSCYWEEALQLNATQSPNKNMEKNTILKSLLEFPSLAERVFDRCCPPGVVSYDKNKRELNQDCPKRKTNGLESLEFHPRDNKLLKGVETEPVDHMWREENVLALVARKKHSNLLTHPLVTNWVQYKWKSYVQYGYYLAVAWSGLHAVLLTTFSLIGWDWREMYEAYQLNQSFVCSFDKPMVGPEVVEFLQEQAQIPNRITFAIYAILCLWVIHHFYRSVKMRSFRMESVILLVCSLLDILFLVNFTECSQTTFVREDWQWVLGSLALTFAWIGVYYQITLHVKHKPLLSSFKRYAIAAKDIIIPFIPIVIVWILLYRYIAKGSQTLNEHVGWFFIVIQEKPSYATLILILVVSTILLAQVRQGQEDYRTKHNDKRMIKAINMILDFDVLYPFIRTYYYSHSRYQIFKEGIQEYLKGRSQKTDENDDLDLPKGDT